MNYKEEDKFVYIKDCFQIHEKSFKHIRFDHSFIDVKFTISPFNNAVLSGGALRDTVNWYPVKDWDIFLGEDDELDVEPKPEHVSSSDTIHSRLLTLGYELKKESSKDYIFGDDSQHPITGVDTYNNGRTEIQVIYLRVPFLDYVKQFNFTCNTMFYSGFYDKFMCPYKEYFFDLVGKKLKCPDKSITNLHSLLNSNKARELIEKGYQLDDFESAVMGTPLDFFL